MFFVFNFLNFIFKKTCYTVNGSNNCLFFLFFLSSNGFGLCFMFQGFFSTFLFLFNQMVFLKNILFESTLPFESTLVESQTSCCSFVIFIDSFSNFIFFF